ncbi:MAG: 4,5-DOPA dioxygenase extradiol [Nitrospirota bacterium]|nr:MAG: 4,5-DOPA dioxygenase extradiol [Nitrospirota bacterium]
MPKMMPAIFFGHGNPMNAVTENVYADGWKKIGRSLQLPKAILAISAHWYIPACTVTMNEQPPTIHDFGGFPQALYDIEYPAPGSPTLARRVADLLSPIAVAHDDRWGLDHGTWCVLMHVFPEADVPTVQLSIDKKQPPAYHYKVGKRLAPLRDEGVLIVGSGNLVHNLHTYAWGDHNVEPFDWAVRFEDKVRDLLLKGDDTPLVDYEGMGQDAMLSIPTPDHYLPLLYILGLRNDNDKVSFPVEGVDGGSVSMLAVQLG